MTKASRRMKMTSTKFQYSFGLFDLSFPFQIHFGWLTAATLSNITSVYDVSEEASSQMQVAIGIGSLAVFHAVCQCGCFLGYYCAGQDLLCRGCRGVGLAGRFMNGEVSLVAAVVTFVVVCRMVVGLIALVIAKLTSPLSCEKKSIDSNASDNQLTESLLEKDCGICKQVVLRRIPRCVVLVNDFCIATKNTVRKNCHHGYRYLSQLSRRFSTNQILL